jgi:hypothetical protein
MRAVHGLNYNDMATLNKTIVTGHDATTPFEYIVPKTFNLKNFTVEATFTTPIGYPAAENDAELRLEDGELNTDGAATTPFEAINGGLVKAADTATRAKLRLVDLDAQNVKIVWDEGSADAGVMDINITFQS